MTHESAQLFVLAALTIFFTSASIYAEVKGYKGSSQSIGILAVCLLLATCSHT